MNRQLRLKLERPARARREPFIASPSNAAARRALEAWPDWHGGLLALVGPEGAGKSHLAADWATRAGAVVLDRAAADLAAEGRPVLLEDVDRGIDPEALFHLINSAGETGGGLLLTARTPPALWPAALPDLRSRLNALPVAQIEEPDDAVLEGVLRKLFRERHIRPADDLFPYLLRRIERSIPQAREVVARLDEAGDAAGRPITRALAREVLEDVQGDLLE
ncbi:MAG: chromosomal replication initiator DnaA [Caulobacteraceae bacterium]|nr:chromosomal replication initiator DnaA [Caulobacteraceae bacterium]